MVKTNLQKLIELINSCDLCVVGVILKDPYELSINDLENPRPGVQTRKIIRAKRTLRENGFRLHSVRTRPLKDHVIFVIE